MANTQAPKGSKPGTKVTFSDGSTGYVTEGGQYRIDSGPNKGKLWGGAVPGAAPAAAAPTNSNPDFANQLGLAKQAVLNQVGANGISQGAADAEIARLGTLSYNDLKAANERAGTVPIAPAAPQSQPFGPANAAPPLAADAPYKTPTDITNIQDVLNQQNISRQEAINRPSEINPFGSSTYVQDPSGGVTRVQTIGNLNPKDIQGWTGEQYRNQSYIDRGLQAIAGEGGANNQGQAGLLPQLRGMFAKPLDFSGLAPVASGADFLDQRNQIIGQAQKVFDQRNNPVFARQREDFEQQMANRGIPVGSEAYNQTLNQLLTSQQDARDANTAQALQLGQGEQQRLYQDANTTRQNQINEQLTQRAQPLSDLKGLLSAVNPVSLPQFNQTANISVPQTNFAGTADNFLTRDANLESAKLGFANQMAIAGLQADAAAAQQQAAFGNQTNQSNLDFQHQQQLAQQQNQFANQNQPGLGSYLGSIGGAALGGLFSNPGLFGGNSNSGGGFFSGIGNFFGGLFS